MKTRISLLACVAFVPVLIAGCALYKNPSACEQQMRSTLAEKSAVDKLTVSHRGVGINGSRVVVEGAIEEPAGASGVFAARAASQAQVASAPQGASAAAPKKPKKVVKEASAECTFEGEKLASFRWLSPTEMVPPADSEDSGDQ